MESFFGTLKPNSFTSVKTPIGMPRDAFGYIEGYYNRQRIHSAGASSRAPPTVIYSLARV